MSQNGSIISSSEIDKFYFSPLFVLNSPAFSGNYLNVYTFIGKNADWEDDFNPPVIDKSNLGIKTLYSNMIYLKRNQLNDISAIIERIDWTANTIYDIYMHDNDLSLLGADDKLLKKFYVRNKYDQVFKCLWNNNNTSNTDVISTITSNTTLYSIQHDGGTYNIGEFITINNSDPEDYNGTYRVIDSDVGRASIAKANTTAYTLYTTNSYTANGVIKYATKSSEEPYFDTGTLDEFGIVETSDGYRWKYLYTLDKAAKLKFFNSDWMPVPINTKLSNVNLSSSGYGSIDAINIINPGSGYNDGYSTVEVRIDGDGTGAVAESYVVNGLITNIAMITTGSNYSYANISIIDSGTSPGTGAIVTGSISPIGGHRFNLPEELYCKNIMITTNIEKTENGSLPTDFSFNQIGILYNPYIRSDDQNYANTSTLTCMTSLITSSGSENYVADEYVYQGLSATDFEYKGKIVSFDSVNNILYLINNIGTPQENYALIGVTSGTSRIVQTVNLPLYVEKSGIIFYAENRTSVQRNELGTEQIRTIINYN